MSRSRPARRPAGSRPSAGAIAATRAERRRHERAAKRSRAPRAVVLAMVLVALLISSFYPARTLIAKRNQVAAMKRTSASLDYQIADLRRQRDWLQTDEAVQEIARSTLGMVEPGETAFAVVPGRSFAPVARSVAAASRPVAQPGALTRWWRAFSTALNLAR